MAELIHLSLLVWAFHQPHYKSKSNNEQIGFDKKSATKKGKKGKENTKKTYLKYD